MITSGTERIIAEIPPKSRPIVCLQAQNVASLRPGRELHSRISVLQTLALLLGYQAEFSLRLSYQRMNLKATTDQYLLTLD